jgi:D-sedoheptulose 7-phosphate isomerase
MDNQKDTFTTQYLSEVGEITRKLDAEMIEKAVALIAATKEGGGRLFVLGVGGSAANASHAVNDFRKIVGIEAYAPTDNVSELTARTNDEGWHTVFEAWLKTSRLNSKDAVMVFSVGGGDEEKKISVNLIHALKHAKSVKAKVIGIVGRSNGYTAQVADACVIIPMASQDRVTPHSEAFQAVVWHLFVSHPLLKALPTKWESLVDDNVK